MQCRLSPLLRSLLERPEAEQGKYEEEKKRKGRKGRTGLSLFMVVPEGGEGWQISKSRYQGICGPQFSNWSKNPRPTWSVHLARHRKRQPLPTRATRLPLFVASLLVLLPAITVAIHSAQITGNFHPVIMPYSVVPVNLVRRHVSSE